MYREEAIVRATGRASDPIIGLPINRFLHCRHMRTATAPVAGHSTCAQLSRAPAPEEEGGGGGKLVPLEARFLPAAQLAYTRRDTTSGQEAGFLSRRRMRGAQTPALPLNFLKGDRATRVPLPSGGRSTGHARQEGRLLRYRAHRTSRIWRCRAPQSQHRTKRAAAYTPPPLSAHKDSGFEIRKLPTIRQPQRVDCAAPQPTHHNGKYTNARKNASYRPLVPLYSAFICRLRSWRHRRPNAPAALRWTSLPRNVQAPLDAEIRAAAFRSAGDHQLPASETTERTTAQICSTGSAMCGKGA